MIKILVTGGTGYIGSQTTIELQKLGYCVVIVDSLANSDILVLDRIESITGIRPEFVEGDVCDSKLMDSIFENHRDIKSVIHFAAYKSVGESVNNPLDYYNNNLNSLITLLRAMAKYNVMNLVFSSSCTVYGQPDILPVNEDTPLLPANSPYGNTKKISEDIIIDFLKSGIDFRAVILRYFNPVGADLSGKIGELPQGIPNNLMPYITQTALGIRDKLMVFGDDYNTPDGTAIRDYIHVVDLANSHILALDYLQNQDLNFYDIFNVGNGEGYSVLDVIKSINKFIDKPLPYQITKRRPGDVEKIWANSDKAKTKLKWIPKYNLDDMTSTAYQWEKNIRGK